MPGPPNHEELSALGGSDKTLMQFMEQTLLQVPDMS